MYEPGGGVLKVSYEIFWTKIKTTTLRNRTENRFTIPATTLNRFEINTIVMIRTDLGIPASSKN